jgi:hypothetical protein
MAPRVVATKGETIFTCAYVGKMFRISSSQEILSLKSSNLHGNFQPWCRIKFVKFIAFRCRVGTTS